MESINIFFNCDWLFEYFKSYLNEYLNSKSINLLYDLCTKLETNLIYVYWLLQLFQPLLVLLLVLFLLPSIIFLLLFASSIYIFYKRHWSNIKAAYHEDIWLATYKSIAAFWQTQATIWHGYEVHGLENIPDDGSGLLIYYHGALPIDFYYIYSKTLLEKNRKFKIVADNFLFQIPGIGPLLEAFEVTPGTLEMCIQLLKEGNLMAISPGGVREALFSDHNYNLIWGSRCGFAKAAILSKAPVIPMFTQNSREAFRSLGIFRSLFRWIYETTRLPLVPIYGMFPVKLRTFIGKPIEYDENRSVEELVELTKKAIEELIEKHQKKRPGNIFYALVERFKKNPPKYD